MACGARALLAAGQEGSFGGLPCTPHSTQEWIWSGAYPAATSDLRRAGFNVYVVMMMLRRLGVSAARRTHAIGTHIFTRGHDRFFQ